ncbi:MAG: hypothetical protein Ta2D_00530 [Rickettsiales bacterium]|nr:MAG: hypothetical protein Ta2D_00530 [Rickettsiales bacterium]
MDFTIKEGLSKESMEQLIEYANDLNDKEVQGTSDPKRFKDRRSIEKWQAKGRFIYTIEKDSKLLGIFWFGKSVFDLDAEIPVAKHQYTFAGRLYGELRGKGQFKTILSEVFKLFVNSSNYDGTGFWGESRHGGMVKICTKLGFKQIGKEIYDINSINKTNSWENPQYILIATDKEIREGLKSIT